MRKKTVVKKTVKRPAVKQRTHPLTKLLLSLRIAVNSEFENIAEALPQAMDLLKKGGRLAVITFHSSEEALVERELGKLTPILPTEKEIENNKKARSAKLWIAEKTKKKDTKKADQKG